MQRAYNFSPGPATLPLQVLNRINQELFDWQGTGVSIMELGHRTEQFQNFLKQLQFKLKKLLAIPDNYQILFMTGGAQGQFDNIPLNLTKNNQNVDYLITGIWSEKAAVAAKKYAKVNIVTQITNNYQIPEPDSWQLNHDACYVYYCTNETVNGICFKQLPSVKNIPLIADMTSSIMSYPVDISQYGLIFASAQKNLGIAGITLVIIRDDLLDSAHPIVPTVWNYKLMALHNSGINTIPVFPVYVMDLMLDWLNEQGGIEVISKINQLKVNKLYDYIDQSGFYCNKVLAQYRSPVNIPFNLYQTGLLAKFLKEADAANLKYLNGHVSAGGARASLYNAMPLSGVEALIDFMQEFAANN